MIIVYYLTIQGRRAAVHHEAHNDREGADRRGRHDHALELPQRHDHEKGGRGPRRRVHLRRQAGGRHSPVRALLGLPGRKGGHSEGELQWFSSSLSQSFVTVV